MPTMEVFGQYELQRLIRDGEIRTFLARELRSGRVLLVHQMAPHCTMFEKVKHLAPADLGLLVSAGELNGLRYIVTHDIPMLHDFERFVRERTPAGPSVPASPVKLADTSSQQDDFARLFGDKPEPEPAFPARAAQLEEPGEFTQMFQTSGAKSGTTYRSTKSDTTVESDPGEFTRFLRVPGPPNQSAEPTKIFRLQPTPPTTSRPAPNVESGEATKLFETPVIPAATPQSSVPKEPPQVAEPGEFTKMFRAPSPAQPEAVPLSAAPPPVRSSEPGEFTRIFRGPTASPSTPERPMDQRPAPATGPGEFTQMFQTPSVPERSGSANPESGSLEPGGFTNFFSPGLIPSPLPEYPKPVQELARRSERDPSEFTKMFGRPSDNIPGNQAGPEPPVASQDPGSGGGATGIFARPALRQPEIAPVQSSAKGDYTRMFEAPAPSPAQEQPQQPPTPIAQQPAATSSARSYLPLILILSILGVVGIILILYFALRK